MNKDILILIDAGHGEGNVNASPDGAVREYAYAREIAAAVVDGLTARGVNAKLLNTEFRDVLLTRRVTRANAACKNYGPENVLLVSIHLNAAGRGGWHSATGWQVCVGRTASRSSKLAASHLAAAAESAGLKVRRQLPGQDWWAQQLYLLEASRCPAVLTENLFQDNREDCAFLLSDKGRKAIADLHISGIVNYINGR